VIRRLLVANRGEIALRIVRACRELGIESIAVYSGADRGAPHVTAADRAIAIGPAPPAESYLSIPRLIDAARATGADAVHPGYGFLSENAAFAEACLRAGLIFVGPPPAVIAQMGSKIFARRLVAAAGVPVVPGEIPDDQTDRGVRRAVERVGLPALVKASAGGGGKGMRRVLDAGAIDESVQAARREALAAFGDGTLYVERLVERPRHVEVQVFGDDHGHVVHLFERDCSAQRRHQKVIEESPSPSLTPRLRARMTEAASAAARAAGYRNAGTIEFLVDLRDGSFYFLEMNTRLQVEHPVTEQVTGRDLVRAQLLVADGQPLPWTQDDLSQRGHAIEARIYAEDPAQGFLPQAGRLERYREPHLPGVRIDSGGVEGGEVSVYYDPMIAKVIATAETRDLAIARLTVALREFTIAGIRTNLPFLVRLLELPAFREGAIDTAFLDREGAALAAQSPAAGSQIPNPESRIPGESLESRIPNPESRSGYDPWDPPSLARVDTRVTAVQPTFARKGTARASAGKALMAPMPATVIRVQVKPGDAVRKGDIVLVLEAMKMELPIRAPGEGIVAAVHCREGDLVQPDTALVEFIDPSRA
jgi:3-methylcrotonyl-CoA carboxylase alpha subunit